MRCRDWNNRIGHQDRGPCNTPPAKCQISCKTLNPTHAKSPLVHSYPWLRLHISNRLLFIVACDFVYSFQSDSDSCQWPHFACFFTFYSCKGTFRKLKPCHELLGPAGRIWHVFCEIHVRVVVTVSKWLILQLQYRKLKWKRCYFDGLFIICCTRNSYFDNFQCKQSWIFQFILVCHVCWYGYLSFLCSRY